MVIYLNKVESSSSGEDITVEFNLNFVVILKKCTFYYNPLTLSAFEFNQYFDHVMYTIM